MTEKKEKIEEVKEEVPVTTEVPEQDIKPEVKHGPRDYLVKAAELLKEHGESKNIKVAQTAIEEALLFIGKEGL